ncbi:uncharacterized protein J3D65DRAFT_617819 [Phyllosticta citribraziliensis]|uniref:Uncharacterized protein n=1 Tax=Phyllosticta citribraziliensis TaxID=989973 RepID=A0ABR1M196_9PEZI
MERLGESNYDAWQRSESRRRRTGIVNSQPGPNPQSGPNPQPNDNRLHQHQYRPRSASVVERAPAIDGYLVEIERLRRLAEARVQHLVPMYAPSRPEFVQPLYPFDYPYGYYYPNDCVVYNNPSNQQHVWYGRTEAEVRDDNKVLAERDGANGRHEIMPRNPRPDQSFWVRDLDGTRYIRPYAFIEDNLRPGEWRVDQRHGNLYFVRARSEE